jgi:hypothetical protein
MRINLSFKLMTEYPVKPIWLELQIDTRDPQLLATLDRLLQSGMLDSEQILQIARACLSETLPIQQTVTVPPPIVIAPVPEPIPEPEPVPTIWQTLKDELSVRWLLFLGVFLVVLSSGVLAATQWSRFPAWGQYGLLWLYTIGFWVTGGWARKQQGLRLTANTLQMAALLLIPVNFWAIDSFGLWHQPWEIATALVATVSLAGMAYFSTFQQRRKSRSAHHSAQWLMGAYAILSLLQLGWQIPHWAAISIYIGAIGVAIVLQKTRHIEKGALAIYGLGMLLLRGLFVVHLPLTSFSLAIGILGWLFAQWGIEHQQKLQRVEAISLQHPSRKLARYQETLAGLITLYHRLGAGLLILGWLLGLGEWQVSPWQSVAIDGLALIWLWQRLQKDERHQDLVWLFVVGLQTYFLSNFLWRFLSTGALLAKVLPTIERLFGSNYLFAGGLLVFPYLLAWVWLTAWFWRRDQKSLCRTGEGLVIGTGLVATGLTGAAPLGLLIDLVASTAILAHLTRRHPPVRTSYLYFTHLCGLLTVFAALNYRWDWCMSFALNLLTTDAVTSNDTFLGLAIGSLVLTVLTAIELWFSMRPAAPDQDGWQRSAWDFGRILAVLAFMGFLLTFSAVRVNLPLWLIVIPAAFTYVATKKSRAALPWQINAKSQASWWAIGGLAGSVVLGSEDPTWRSILLAISVAMMFPIVRAMAHRVSTVLVVQPMKTEDFWQEPNDPTSPVETSSMNQSTVAAAIHIGFGLGLGLNLLAGHISTPLWLILGAVVCSGLWFVSKKLRSLVNPHQMVYATASDVWAIGIATIEMVIGSGHYLYTNIRWLAMLSGLTLDLHDSKLAPNADIVGALGWLNSLNLSLLVTALILLWAMVDRQRWSNSMIPVNILQPIWFCSAVVTSQFGLSAAVHLLGGGTWALAIANVVLAFFLWLWQLIIQKSRPYRNITGSLAVLETSFLPGLLAVWGLWLRLPFFNSYSGLLSIGVGLIGVLVSRSYRSKWSAYGGLILMTLGCYELITYQILQAPAGGNIADALTIYGLATAVLALIYRLVAWVQTRRGQELCWDLPLTGLKNVAHGHWAVASAWKIAAAVSPPIPIPHLTILHLFTSGLLGIYALIQGRDRDRGDWWVYLGFAELMGVGIYARSIFQGLGVVDNGLILVACLVGLLLMLAPWSEWGWQDRPWRSLALVLPLSRVVFEWNYISLLNLAILATFYAGVARRQKQFGWAYLSLVFVNWAGMRLLWQHSLTSPLWYAIMIGLSILVVVQWDPAWQRSRQNRHYGRLAGVGIIAVAALIWHVSSQPWVPIGLGLAIGAAGLGWRVRAWLYVGTITFLLSNFYQLVILITEQPVTKWAIGLIAGMLIILLAANFERRKEQITQALQHWLDRLQEWQ